MANQRIEGLTIALGGDTEGFVKAIKETEQEVRRFQTEVSSINKALKLNPESTELLTQKMTVLGNISESVAKKLKQLEAEQAQVNTGFDRAGNAIPEEAIRIFNREIESTHGYLSKVTSQLAKTKNEFESIKNPSEKLTIGLDDVGKSASLIKNKLEDVKKPVKDLGDSFQNTGDKASIFGDVLKANIISGVILDTVKSVAAAIPDIANTLINTSAEIQAEAAQFGAAFGGMKDAAIENFDIIAEKTGILSSRLQIVGTEVFSQFKGAGLEASDALLAMTEFTEMAADAAAYYDITIEEASYKLRSFMRGNTEAGDSIGLFTSESQRNAAAVELTGMKYLELTEAQKQMVMLDISKNIYENSGALGQAAREADGYANVTGNLSEAWRQLVGIIGDPALAIAGPALESITDVILSITVISNLLISTHRYLNLCGSDVEFLLHRGDCFH